MNPDGLVSPEYAPVWLSLFVGYGVGVVGLAGLALYGCVKAWAAARQGAIADRTIVPGAPLAEGFAAVAGTVELAEGADHALRVEILQAGKEQVQQSGDWTTSWTEKKRTIHVHPFYIRRADGERVRVEPTREAYLVDALDGVLRVNLTQRVLVAELISGEHVVAVGVLSRASDPEVAYRATGYREGGQRGWLLRAPPRERLLLSTEAVGERYRRRARFRLVASAVTCLVLIGVNLLLLPFHARALAGTDRVGRVERTWTTTSDTGQVTHYDYVAVTVDGEQLEELSNVPGAVVGQTIDVRWVEAWPGASAIGSSARAPAAHLPFVLIAWMIAAVFHVFAGWRGVGGWYDRPALTEERRGRLADRDG